MKPTLSFLDRLISEVDHALKTVLVPAKQSTRPSPADPIDEGAYTDAECKHISGLMRVDHTGEICAQALYRGQALVAKEEGTREHLLHAADEEYDHLYWCQKRLDELGAKTSLLNPAWYLGSFAIGATAGLISDKLSYGFVAETEEQVMKHLDKHLKTLPSQDLKSQAILKQMYSDEADHATQAKNSGAQALPLPVKLIMKAQSKVMTTTAYKI